MEDARELAETILRDLSPTLPDDLRWSVRVDGQVLYFLLRREGGPGSPGLSSESGTPWPQTSRCALAEKIVSDVQDFMADAYSVWWPQLGRRRLNVELQCLDNQPRLIFTL